MLYATENITKLEVYHGHREDGNTFVLDTLGAG